MADGSVAAAGAPVAGSPDYRDSPDSAGPWPGAVSAAAVAAVGALRAAGVTVATAESLTGGLIGAAITSVAGSSAAYRGGVVAYATDLKHQLLGVDDGLLGRVGAVHPEVAQGMAEGVRERLGADYGVAVTGVAGPDPQDGAPPGTVWLAVAGPAGSEVVDVSSQGTRAQVRFTTTALALALLRDAVSGRVCEAATGAVSEAATGGVTGGAPGAAEEA